MNDRSNDLATPVSVEEMILVSYDKVRNDLGHRYHDCKDHVRRSPTAAILGAVGIGYLLHRLPLRAILVTQVRVLSALAPPALFLYGAAKLLGFLQQQKYDIPPVDHDA